MEAPVMNLAAYSWGLTLNETLLIIAAILIVIDIFFQSDIPTHVAYVLICTVVARVIHAPILIQVLIGILAWFALVGGHYLLWKKKIQRLVHRVIAPERYREGARGLVGSTGQVRAVEDATMVRVAGDLWPFRADKPVTDGQNVRVIAVEKGRLVIEPLDEPAGEGS
jgi:membrane protein implicated in regulation of membrane protease activity